MNYYISPESRCYWMNCEKPITDSVRSSGTVSYGKYCNRHAKMKLARLEKMNKSIKNYSAGDFLAKG